MTINDIQNAMTKAGSHWFDTGTLRFFKCRVHYEVYEGDNGIFFVTSEQYSEQPRAYTVRQYIPETTDIKTIGDFNTIPTRKRAHTIARNAAGDSLKIVSMKHKPRTEAEQLALDITSNGGQCSPSTAASLMFLATKHDNLMVDYRNERRDIYDQDGEPGLVLSRLQKLLTTTAKDCLCGIKLGGDPRGCTAKLIMPNGETNDWGKEGWCIPTHH